MTNLHSLGRRGLLASLVLAFASLASQAAELRVITSGAFTEAYKKLVPIRRLTQSSNKMKIGASVLLGDEDEEVEVHGEPDCGDIG